MSSKSPTPLQLCFWITPEERGYILVVLALLCVGILARYFYLKNETSAIYKPADIEKVNVSYE